jgi:hypothetical protein
MARATAFGVMPTPYSSLGSAGPHGRPPPSMTSVGGCAPGRRVGVCAIRCKSTEVFILYEDTSTVVRAVVRVSTPPVTATPSRAAVATTRDQSGRQRRAVRQPRLSVPVSGGIEGRAPLGQAAPTTYAEGRATVRFPGSRACQENGTTKRIRAFFAASPVKSRGGLVRTPDPWKHTGTVRTGRSPSISQRTLAHDSPTQRPRRTCSLCRLGAHG